jgi:signal transduction histidine kinase
VEALRSTSETGSPIDTALAELARTFTSQSGVPVHLHADAAGAHPEIERVAYRIAQEALTNVRRHAKAKNVWLEAKRKRGHLVVTVRDDGIGFPNNARGMGIEGMLERARSIGGTLTVRRQPSGGTLVRATLPAAPA